MTPLEKSTLKLAQFRSSIGERKLNDKYIKSLIQGIDLNVTVPKTVFLQEYNSELIGKTLLHLAYDNSNFRVFNILIHKGADITAKNKNGNTVIHEFFRCFSILYGSLKWDIKKENSFLIARKIPSVTSMLSAHIQYKITDNPSDSNGLTHFHVACANNCVEAIEFFLSNGVFVDQAVVKAIQRYFQGYTGLHFAAQYGHLEVIEILLKHGANANLKDAHARTPLHISLERNITMIESTMVVHSPEDIMINEKIMNLLLNHTMDSKLPRLCVVSAMQDLDQTALRQASNINQSIIGDSQNWPGYTVLHFAAHVNVNTVKLLMNHGADVEAKDANGVTPFDMCMERYKAEDIFDILRQNPKWQNIELSDGKTKLTRFVSALSNENGISTFLQESTENIKLFVPFNSPLWPGFTLLHIAVLLSERTECKLDYKVDEKYRPFNPDLTVITKILKQGADVTIKDHRSWTPVHLAFRLEKLQTLYLLLKYHHKMKNFVDDVNLSHLHVACAAENQDLVEKLLWNDVDVNVVYEGDSPISGVHPGWTPLHIAVHMKNREITKLLLKFGADVYLTDKYGSTPIHELQLYCRELGRMLFDVPNLRDIVVEDSGLSYLHVACWNGNLVAVKRLLDLGVDVNKVIKIKNDNAPPPSMFNEEMYDGKAPLHCALKRSIKTTTRLQIVSLLIERGADLLLNDSYKITPLREILARGNGEFLDVFLQTLKSKENLRKRVEAETGVTMLHIACRKIDKQSVKELLESGVDVNARIPEESTLWPGYSPLHFLVLSFGGLVDDGRPRDEFDDIMKMMLEHGADVISLNAKRCTPLHMAYDHLYSQEDDASMPQILMMLKAQKNFEVNPTNVEGISHFHIACHMLVVDVVEKFLEHEVDVNSRIDPFLKFDISAKSPLLLAVQKINWVNEAELMNKSLAQLKIVDMLMKRGARVDVEDICGNAPAHHAALGSFAKGNLLQRLVNSGANMNTRNVRGETPLELLLRKENLTFEEVRYFISCGCIFNAFNPMTDEGYIALAASRFSHKDVLCLIFGTFVNFPDLMENDDANRTAIHNIASIHGSKINETQYAELLDMMMKFGCDVDDQDEFGKTALHLAALFRNVSAVAGLFLVGADVNIADHDGFTPFTCLFQLCLRYPNIGKEYLDSSSHVELSCAFVGQIRKLQFCNLDLCTSNQYFLNETFKRYDPSDLVDPRGNFLVEFEKIRKLEIKPYQLTIMDFISNAVAVMDYPIMSRDKRRAIDDFFRTNRSYFQTEFRQAAGVVRLQYRQALLRRRIIDAARDSLSTLMRLRLPDICSRIILRFLRNYELKYLILAVSESETTRMDLEDNNMFR